MGAYDRDCINNLEYDRRERKAQLSQEGTTSDMISRQAAIDALMDAVKKVGVLDADDIKTVFDALPSVQHEKVQPSSEGTTFDTISRQAAIDAAEKIIERDTSGNNAVVNAMIAWSEYIRTLPTIQPEPHEGEWIVHLYKVGISRYECDACHARCDIIYPYCPYCGEKKEGERNAID